MRTLFGARGSGVGGEERGEEHWLLLIGSNRGAHEMALLGRPALRESAPPGCSDLAGGRAQCEPGPEPGSCLLSGSLVLQISEPSASNGAEAVTQAIPATAYIG